MPEQLSYFRGFNDFKPIYLFELLRLFKPNTNFERFVSEKILIINCVNGSLGVKNLLKFYSV